MSLLDTAGTAPIDYLLVYTHRADDRAWWTRWLHRELYHVEVWRDLGDGYYLALCPNHDFLTFDLVQGEPTGTVQRVTAYRKVRKALWPLGLKTCVTVAKAALGLRAPWVITPRQLFNHIHHRNGIV